MFIPGCAEKEPRSAGHEVHRLLAPLHVLLGTPASPEPRELGALEAVERIARSHEPVWITAEVGAGAAWLAQLVHDQSAGGAAFAQVECEPGRAPALLDGRGTVFLAFPERLSPEHQEELLAYLRRSDLRHLEGLRTVPPFPRLIAWSLAAPAALARAGKILPGLAQALGRVQIAVPPLRAQREPLDTFAGAILEQIATHEGLTLRRLTPEALAALRAYGWPGNLAELRSLLERACLLAGADQLELDREDLPLGGGTEAKEAGPLATPHRPRTMSEIEEEAIRAAIDWNSGNLVRAARELRIGRATLYRKLKKYGIPTRSQKRQLAR